MVLHSLNNIHKFLRSTTELSHVGSEFVEVVWINLVKGGMSK